MPTLIWNIPHTIKADNDDGWEEVETEVEIEYFGYLGRFARRIEILSIHDVATKEDISTQPGMIRRATNAVFDYLSRE